jgi:hypothetical protein
MTDYSELVERMRAYPANKLCIQIANALEAQAQEISQYQVDVNEALLDCKRLHARIAELEAENGRLRDLAYIAYQDGYKDAPPHSKYERTLDQLEYMWKKSFAYAALKGENDG